MVSIETAIEEFPQTIERYSSHSDMDELEMITNGIEQLIYQNPTAYDEKSVSRYLNQRAATLKNMVEEYFSASIAQKFPLLSDDLFGLKRYIVLKSEGRKWKIIDDGTLPNKIDFTIPQKPIKPLNPKKGIQPKKRSFPPSGITES